MEILGTIQYDITPQYYVIVEAAPTSDRTHPDYHDVWNPPQDNPKAYDFTVPTDVPHWIVFYESIDGVTKGDVIASFFQTADNIYIPLSQKGVALGVATLDADGKVPSSQLPASTDAILNQFTSAQVASAYINGTFTSAKMETGAAPGAPQRILYNDILNISGNKRWIQRLADTETGSGNVGSNLLWEPCDDSGVVTGDNVVIERATGNLGVGVDDPTEKIDVAGNGKFSGTIQAANGSKIIATAGGAGTVNFMANDGTTLRGRVGVSGVSDGDIYMETVAGGVYFKLGAALPFSLDANFLDLNIGALRMLGTSNMINVEGGGSGVPTLGARSAGTKLSLHGTGPVSGAAEFAIGYDTTQMWFSVPNNSTGNSIIWYGAATPIATLDGTGNMTLTGSITAAGGGFNSARALKENIREFTARASELINKIPVQQFNYRHQKNNIIGFIADEVPKEVLMDDIEAIDIYSTIGLLIKGFQELSEDLKTLTQKVDHVLG